MNIDGARGVCPHSMTTRSLIALIQTLVAGAYRVRVDDLRSNRRPPSLVEPRWVGLWLSRTLTGASFHELGQRFGGLDHSTVQNACRRMREKLAQSAKLRETVLSLRNRVAMNIPDPPHVARGMRLTIRVQASQLLVEIAGEQPVELSGHMSLRPVGGRVIHGSAWIAVPDAQRGLWAAIVAPEWHDLSVEAGPDEFKTGRILLSAGGVGPAPADVLESLGSYESASFLAEFSADPEDAWLHQPLTTAEMARIETNLSSGEFVSLDDVPASWEGGEDGRS